MLPLKKRLVKLKLLRKLGECGQSQAEAKAKLSVRSPDREQFPATQGLMGDLSISVGNSSGLFIVWLSPG